MNLSGAAYVLLWEFWFVMVLCVHMISGILALLTSWVPLTTLKGSHRHKSGGLAFVRAVTVMAITSVLITLMRKSNPIAPSTTLPILCFSLYISIFTAAMTWYGLRVIQTRRPFSLFEKIIAIAFLIISAATSFYGVLQGYLLLSLFPIVGLILASLELYRWQVIPRETSVGSLRHHYTSMLLAVIGAWTTFAVITLPLFIDISPLSTWLWSIPAIVFLPLLFYWSLYPPIIED